LENRKSQLCHLPEFPEAGFKISLIIIKSDNKGDPIKFSICKF
jgi:hypothetical protein